MIARIKKAAQQSGSTNKLRHLKYETTPILSRHKFLLPQFRRVSIRPANRFVAGCRSETSA